MSEIHSPTHGDVTRLLERLALAETPEPELVDDLLTLLYAELRVMAHRQRQRMGEGARHLQTTELVHELYMKLERQLDSGASIPQSREHFFAYAACALRHLLVDAVRGETRLKRGGSDRTVSLSEVVPVSWFEPKHMERAIDVHHALERIEVVSPEYVRLVELHVFLGLTLDEIAELRGTSRSTVKRQWRKARAWVAATLEDSG